MVVIGYSGNTRLINADPQWEFLGYHPQTTPKITSRLRGPRA